MTDSFKLDNMLLPHRTQAPTQSSEQVPEVVEMELSLPQVWETVGHWLRRTEEHRDSTPVQHPPVATTASDHLSNSE